MIGDLIREIEQQQEVLRRHVQDSKVHRIMNNRIDAGIGEG